MFVPDTTRMILDAEICMTHEKDRISSLPDDLLLKILSQLPTRVAVKTMVLSKRWRFLWTMTPKLDYSKNYNYDKSFCYFLDKSMQFHKALLLESLRIQLDKSCHVDADIGKWVSYAVSRCIRELYLEFYLIPLQILPPCLYSCKTLEKLTLSNQILVDVPSSVCLPSLRSLELIYVVYKDEDSHVKLLSSCPVLKSLFVNRDKDDNVTKFSVKVPSLEKLTYQDYDAVDSGRSLVIDSSGLRYVDIYFPLGDEFSITKMPRLDVALLKCATRFALSHKIHKFPTSFSSVMFLDLVSTEVKWFSAINFSRLIEFTLSPFHLDDHWLESLMFFLKNSPKLKVLKINSDFCTPFRWNKPSSVPGCLLSHLEIFEWKAYGGRREEKQFVAYVLANSKSLKTVRIDPRSFYKFNEKSLEKEQKMKEELKSMYRVSTSSQLLFSDYWQWVCER